MSILRVPIYTFWILRHPGSMIQTQFLRRVKLTTYICLKAGVPSNLQCTVALKNGTCYWAIRLCFGEESDNPEATVVWSVRR